MTRPALADPAEAEEAWRQCSEMVREAARYGDRRALRLIELGERFQARRRATPSSPDDEEFMRAMGDWIWC